MRCLLFLVTELLILISFVCSIYSINNYRGIDLVKVYHHFKWLNKEKSYKLYWNIDHDIDGFIECAVEVNTTGWIGFGISTVQGLMPNSDIILGWIDSSTQNVIIKDSNTMKIGRHLPNVDKLQNVEIIDGIENNGWSILRFKRKIKSCEQNDRDIEIYGTTRIIYAYSPNNMDGPNIDFHGFGNNKFHGSKSINFFTDPAIQKQIYYDDNYDDSNDTLNDIITYKDPNNGEKYEYFDIKMDEYHSSDLDTEYFCILYKLPDLKHHTKAHIVGYDALIQKGSESLVHHIMVTVCPKKYNSLPEDKVVGQKYRCFMLDTPDIFNECRNGRHIANWLVGAEHFEYNKNLGILLEDKNDKYGLMEIHYNNPQRITNIIDSSGIRFYFTYNLRKYSVGALWVGIDWYPRSYFIPPKQEIVQNIGLCSSKCISAVMDRNKINKFHIIASTLHGHTTATSLKLRQFRNGREYRIIDVNTAYDFNFQQNIDLYDDEIILLPSDDLIIECNYSTINRNHIVLSGPRSMDEMCVSYLQIYPAPTKINWVSCFSKFNKKIQLKWIKNAIEKKWIINYDRNDTINYKLTFDMKYNKDIMLSYNKLWHFQEIEQFCTSDLIHGIINTNSTAKMPKNVYNNNHVIPSQIVECFQPQTVELNNYINTMNIIPSKNINNTNFERLLILIVFILGIWLTVVTWCGNNCGCKPFELNYYFYSQNKVDHIDQTELQSFI